MCAWGCLHLCALPWFNMTLLTHLAVNFSSSSTESRGHTSKQLMMIEWERSPSYEPARACSPGFTDTWLGINKRHWIWLPRNTVRHSTHLYTHRDAHVCALAGLRKQPARRQFPSYTSLLWIVCTKWNLFISLAKSFFLGYYYFIHSNRLWKDCIPAPTGELPSITSHALYTTKQIMLQQFGAGSVFTKAESRWWRIMSIFHSLPPRYNNLL